MKYLDKNGLTYLWKKIKALTDKKQNEWGSANSGATYFSQGPRDVQLLDVDSNWKELRIAYGIPMGTVSPADLEQAHWFVFTVNRKLAETNMDDITTTPQFFEINNAYPSDSDGWACVRIGRQIVGGRDTTFIRPVALYASKTSALHSGFLMIEVRV